MDECTAHFDDLDLETADLILKLQLQDVEELRANSKDKNRDGELNDAQVALSLFEENIESMRSILFDRQMTQSITAAVRADAEAIADVIREEEVACEDHAHAHRLNGSCVTSEVHLQSGDLSKKIPARLAGRYVSQDVGYELLKDIEPDKWREPDDHGQAESSIRGSAREHALRDPSNLVRDLPRGQEVL
ncbi:hypothetical protein AYO20_02098 [Fonsecaea nubica]|uniref:Uncharacterized protein n=1 Tax=Fonsecaea nubica TaxID=856822 RepID=A0A178D8G9_9EURO|nr:hypothetical protein AYO20_02098 [Fonsecaea nubica]OAL38449.1 hypothetical protein AYO20_02098 [Fonsecaea nubica]